MWFVVPIYFRSSEPLDGEPLLEEAFHLIDAGSDEEAAAKARGVSKTLEHRYKNVLGTVVAWTVDEVGEPWEVLDALGDRAEIYSRFMTEKNREALRERLGLRN